MCENFRAAKPGTVIDLARLSRRDIVLGLAGGTLALVSPGCATNPETGRSQLLFVSDEQLAQMAVDAWAEQKSATAISNDSNLNGRLRRVGTRVQQGAGRANEQWEFVVFDTEEKNAFVLPGGKVGVYKGLMELVENEDQLAAVLGHETGHVTAHHAAERASQSTLASLGMALGSAVIGTENTLYSRGLQQVFGLGVQYGVLMPYGRLQELEADRLGVDYMNRADYDVRQAIRLWELMGTQDGGARPPEILSTHPAPETRMAELRAYINSRGYAVV